MNTNNNNNDMQYNESPTPPPSQPQTSSTQHIECNDFNYDQASNNNNCGDFCSTNDVREDSQTSSLNSSTPSVPEVSLVESSKSS